MKVHRRLTRFGYDLYSRVAVCEKALDYGDIKELDIVQLREMTPDRIILSHTTSDVYDAVDNDITVDGATLRNHFSKPIKFDQIKTHSLVLTETRYNPRKLLNPLNWFKKTPITFAEMVKYEFGSPRAEEIESLSVYLRALIRDHTEVYQEFQESISYVSMALNEIDKNEHLYSMFPEKVAQAERLIKEYYKFAIAVRKRTDEKVREMLSQSISNHDEVVGRLIDGMAKINSTPAVSMNDAKKVEFSPPENTIRDANIYFSENMNNINETNIKVTSKERSDSTLGEFADAVCRALE